MFTMLDDTLIEILAHLPLDSIYKFKCLSKVWLSNLSHPTFITRWLQINEKSVPWILYHGIAYHDDEENPLRFRKAYPEMHSQFISRNEYLFSFKFLMNEKPLEGAALNLIGSSNGLVLCLSVGSIFQRRYHVCNPLTRTRVSLPLPPGSQVRGTDVSGIFCEYSSSFTSSYKVVRIPECFSPSKKFIVDIFSSNLGVWESFQVSCEEDVEWRPSNHNNVVILNGVLYWRIKGWNRLLIYNLNQNNGSTRHRCSLIDLPHMEFDNDHYDSYYLDCILGESEGWVCYAEIIHTARGLTLSVWVLDEVHWKILHRDILVDNIIAELCSRSGVQDATADEYETGDQDSAVQVLGFSLLDSNVVLLGAQIWVWGFNVQTKSLEELCLDDRHVWNAGRMSQPFVLMPRPTVLIPPQKGESAV